MLELISDKPLLPGVVFLIAFIFGINIEPECFQCCPFESKGFEGIPKLFRILG